MRLSDIDVAPTTVVYDEDIGGYWFKGKYFPPVEDDKVDNVE